MCIATSYISRFFTFYIILLGECFFRNPCYSRQCRFLGDDLLHTCLIQVSPDYFRNIVSSKHARDMKINIRAQCTGDERERFFTNHNSTSLMTFSSAIQYVSFSLSSSPFPPSSSTRSKTSYKVKRKSFTRITTRRRKREGARREEREREAQWLSFLEHGSIRDYHFRRNESRERCWYLRRGRGRKSEITCARAP